MPFPKIYHDAPFSAEEREEIIHRRHAEVHVPNRLSLSSLRYVYTRSVAERETLLDLLNHDTPVGQQNAQQVSLDQIRVNTRNSLFWNRWTYIDRVTLEDAGLHVNFNPNSRSPGPFTLGAKLIEPVTRKILAEFERSGYHIAPSEIVQIPTAIRGDRFRFEMFLDGWLAFSKTFDPAVSRRPIVRGPSSAT